MNAHADLIDELELAIAHGDIERRAETLRRVTDLFVMGSGRFSAEHIELFDHVLQRLIVNAEISARSTVSCKLAMIPDAPGGIIRSLALDEAIDVAGPILSHSERLSQSDIIYSAQTMQQPHLLAIAQRKRLVPEITDILLDRGNDQVAKITVCNLGADFSDFGHSVLLRKSRHDQELALTVWCRADLPREILAKLFMDASESVRNLFATREPEKVELIRDVVASASSQTLTQRATPTRYIEALAVVEPLHRSGQLSEEHLEKFAKAGHFERVAIALSRMSEVSTDLIERALTQSRAEQFLVIAKAINLSWDTTKTILSSRIMSKIISDAEIEQAFISFTRLQRKTAKTALQFYRLRARATVSL